LRQLQADHGGVELAQIAAGTGGDDGQLDRLGTAELARLRTARQVQGTLGAAERTLDVGHHREVPGPTTHPPGRAQLAESLGPLTGVVRGDAGGFANRRDAGCAVAGVAAYHAGEWTEAL